MSKGLPYELHNSFDGSPLRLLIMSFFLRSKDSVHRHPAILL